MAPKLLVILNHDIQCILSQYDFIILFIYLFCKLHSLCRAMKVALLETKTPLSSDDNFLSMIRDVQLHSFISMYR